MEYQAQQAKLFPPLAATFAFHFAAELLWKQYNTANESIEQGDLQLLPDLHGLACALKALCSSETANVCRNHIFSYYNHQSFLLLLFSLWRRYASLVVVMAT